MRFVTTQNQRLIEWCRTHDGITTLEASDHLRICRVSERFREIEDDGYTVSRTPETTENGARVIRYRLGARKAVPQGATSQHGFTDNPAGTAPDTPTPCFDRQGRLICYAVSK